MMTDHSRHSRGLPTGFHFVGRLRCLRDRFLFAISCITILGLFGPGCSRGNTNLSRVEGTVTLDSSPLANAFIVFAPERTGTTSYGKTDSAGNFEMFFSESQKGAWVGVNRVQISTGDVGGGEKSATPERVPLIYNTQTRLAADVVPGKNHFQFDLKSNGAKIIQGTRGD